jgi:histidinol-phosphate aminotransferase
LDANENPYDTGLNRYPDPLARKVKKALSKIKGIAPEHIFLGNGSDEVIDVLIRIFCEPRVDNIIILPPTYGMYQVSADTSDVAIKRVNLTSDFQMDVAGILKAADEHTKILFICSPNNPTGNAIDADKIGEILKKFKGIVVIDEAYADFSSQKSALGILNPYPNLVVMQTFSKAWGLAAIRLGIAYASEEIIELMNKVKPPYNVNQLTQQAALKALKKEKKTRQMVAEILVEREKLAAQLRGVKFVKLIYPTDANFLLVKVTDADKIYQSLLTYGIVVRNRNNVVLCEGGLRITVGTPEENAVLIKTMKSLDI